MCFNPAVIPTMPATERSASALEHQYELFLKAQAGCHKRIRSEVNRAVSKVIFSTASKAIEDTRGGVNSGKFRVVSAPTGSSKTTSAIAFAAAAYTTIPGFSCAFVVEEIRAAQEIYQQLVEMLPSEAVGVWTSQNDVRRPPVGHTGETPLFNMEQMKGIQIVVFTHNKWMTEVERNADYGVRRFRGNPRDVMFIDEQPKLIEVLDKGVSSVTAVRDAILKMEPDHPWVGVLSDAMMRMENIVRTDGDEMEAVEILHCLEAHDFTMEKAEAIWRKNYGIPSTEEYREAFKFLQACTLGYVFLSRSPRGFVAYLPKFKPEPNQVLLDATADLSGISSLMGGELATGLPAIDYSNLTIHHLDQPTKFKYVNAVLDVRSRAVAYAEWIQQVVMENSNDGDDILVVMHKKLISFHELFPYAPTEQDTHTFPRRKAWIINWGQGIGSNTYKNATKVFLMSEFYMPRNNTVATTLGATSTQAKDAPLAKLSKHITGEFLDVKEGDILRWIKQLACRGNVRNINEDGTCGAMDLYLSMDFKRLVLNKDRLFPGAKAPTRVKPKAKQVEANGEVKGGRDGLLNLLSTTDAIQVSSKGVETITGIASRDLRRELSAPAIKATAEAYGWALVSSKTLGKPGKGNWLVRTA